MATLPSCLRSQRTSDLSPVFALRMFIAIQVQHSFNSSNQWLHCTSLRSHAFRYGRRNKCLALTRIGLAKLPTRRPLGLGDEGRWCIRKNVPTTLFAATGADRTVATASSGNHDCLPSGTTTTALALQRCIRWSTTATFAEPSMGLTTWPITSTPTLLAV